VITVYFIFAPYYTYSIASTNQIVNQNVCVLAFASEREPRAGARMCIRIHPVDGTLGSLYLDQVAASGCFKEALVSWYKLTASLVELFDRLAKVEWLRVPLFDVGN
jgi:hypothetical protein